MKTPMQELHDWLNDKWSDPGRMLSCYEFYLKIEELLPKEKQAIIDFHIDCVEDGATKEGESVTEQDKVDIKIHAEQYFNEKFGSDGKE